jgi:hypothetical protein
MEASLLDSKHITKHFFCTVTCISDLQTGFGSVNRFVRYLQAVNTSNYNTLKITVTSHKMYSSTSVHLSLLGNGSTNESSFLKLSPLELSLSRILLFSDCSLVLHYPVRLTHLSDKFLSFHNFRRIV